MPPQHSHPSKWQKTYFHDHLSVNNQVQSEYKNPNRAVELLHGWSPIDEKEHQEHHDGCNQR